MSTRTGSDGMSHYGEEFWEFLRDTWLGYALVLPATVLLGVIVIYPTLRGVYLSFFESSLLAPGQSTFVGFQNFVRMANDPTFWLALKNSVVPL